MKKLILILFALSPSLAFATAYTASVTGNWNNAATWGGAGVPGSGDTATIDNGITVTCPVSVTCLVGTSPTSDTGTIALNCASSTGTGILIVYGTLQWQGPVRQCNATWIVEAGGELLYDATNAATPASALYTWQISQASSSANALLEGLGTSGSPVTIASNGSVASGGFGNVTNYTDGGSMECYYCNISYQGAASSSGYLLTANQTSANSKVVFDHSTIANCGMIYQHVSEGAASTFQVSYTTITNSANTTYTMELDMATAITSGVRKIINSVIAGEISVATSPTVNTGLTMSYNVFELNSVASGGTSVDFGNAPAGIGAWDQNMFFTTSDASIANIDTPSGDLTNTYLYSGGDPGNTGLRIHPVYFGLTGPSNYFDHWIVDFNGQSTQTNIFELNSADSSSARTTEVEYTIFLPNSIGTTVGAMLNDSSLHALTNTVINYIHNTNASAAGNTTSVTQGVGCEGAGTTWSAGAVAAEENNIYWAPSSSTIVANNAVTASGCAISAGAVTAADYNGKWNNSNSNIYVNAQFLSTFFAATPGTHDVSGNPGFVDTTRNLSTADIAFFGNSIATAWATSTGYSVGQKVSTSVAGYYSGTTINYTCVQAHTSSTLTEPGSTNASATWIQYWVPSGLIDVQNSILSGFTYLDGNYAPGELVNWVRGGYAPTNSAFHNTASDGTDIGAVPYAGASGTSAVHFGSIL